MNTLDSPPAYRVLFRSALIRCASDLHGYSQQARSENHRNLGIQDLPQTQAEISRLRELGCGISLDDFGTGYPSLCQIHALPLTKLKVDRTFVTNLHLDPASFKIIKSLIALCQDMQLECIVEGVEAATELGALKSLGCKQAQGYLFAKPMRASDIRGWLEGEHLAEALAV
ncbi:EAL domain-containing protein [Pseudomonas oryzihabitans]|uniref:EAL domain-containing protein n=1 Tax=Pseudomonas oryzihabitans TaxID=47885 RepID=UPI0021B25A51|nr:EAL domain-containing protein [Pseudomonas psychrotolerans]